MIDAGLLHTRICDQVIVLYVGLCWLLMVEDFLKKVALAGTFTLLTTI